MAIHPLEFLEINHDYAIRIFIVIQCIYTFILCPLSIYYTVQLWKLHKHKVSFITKRRPQTVIFGIFLFNFFPVIIRPLTDLPQIYPPFAKYYNLYIRIALINTIHLFMFAMLSRLWLLFYDYKKSTHSLSLQWKKHILNQKDRIPWTIKYKWLGNTKIIYCIAISIWILVMFIILLSSKSP